MEPLPLTQDAPADLTPRDGWTTFLVAGLGALGLSLLVGGLALLVWDTDQPAFFAVVSVAGQVGLLAGLLYARRRGPAWPKLLALRPVTLGQVVTAVVGLLACSLAGDRLASAVRQVMPQHQGTLQALTDALSGVSWPAFAAAAVAIAAIPAVVEESLFRGALQRAFEPLWRGVGAILVPSILFAVIHLDPVQGASALVLGLYLGLVRRLTGSLHPCLAAHAVNNLVGIVLLRLHGLEALSISSPLLVWSGLVVALAMLALLARRDP